MHCRSTFMCHEFNLSLMMRVMFASLQARQAHFMPRRGIANLGLECFQLMRQVRLWSY